jgi:ABC-type molybdate transport system substrate-binding protein
VTTLTGPRATDAAALVAFLLSPEAQAILARHGFAPLSAPGTTRP